VIENRHRCGRSEDWLGGSEIVVAALLEFGSHGLRAARTASVIISHYLKMSAISATMDQG
jgi:hypothetical protein